MEQPLTPYRFIQTKLTHWINYFTQWEDVSTPSSDSLQQALIHNMTQASSIIICWSPDARRTTFLRGQVRQVIHHQVIIWDKSDQILRFISLNDIHYILE